MIDKINALKVEIEGLAASNAEEVEALRIKYLSKKGIIGQLMADFRNVPAEEKRTLGPAINEVKTLATDKINALKEALASADDSADELDLTRTPAPLRLGTRLSLIHI